jgi:mannosyl-3-phosphoglycerate phosphatase
MDLHKKKQQLVIFTDLDGTLIDHLTHSFQPALPALAALKERNIPLVFCSSKTRSEIERIRKRTENTHPFIVENGGAVFIPNKYFPPEPGSGIDSAQMKEKDLEYRVIELGSPYPQLREILSQIQARFPGAIRGFGDLSVAEISKLCQFSLDEAFLARQREYDEPFILANERLLGKIQEIAEHSSLQVTQGGRFLHLMGTNDKGQAVLRLIDLYRRKFGFLQTAALGDSLNVLPMLAAVDIPVLLPKPDGRYDPSVKLDGLFFAKDSGPRGWCDSVLEIIRDSKETEYPNGN